MMSGTLTQKKTANEIPAEVNCGQFFSGRQYERLEGLLFLDLSADNGNEDVPIRDNFGFIRALHLLPAVF